MIKDNELRIGNIVKDNDGDIIRVNYKTFELLEAFGYCYLEPIPLTEEILLKCGAKKLPHFTVTNCHLLDLGRNRFLSFSDMNNANQMVWLQTIDESRITDLVCVHNYDYNGKMMLHQLQNLYFALTGEELEVKL